MNRIQSFLIVTILAMSYFHCNAETTTQNNAIENTDTTLLPVWSYDQCVSYAKDNNINLKQQILTSESGKYDLEGAKAKWFPTLNFATTQSYSNRPRPASGINNNAYEGSYGLNLGWSVYDGNIRGNTIKKQELQTKINDCTVDEIYNNLETSILTDYIQILYAKEAIDIANQTLEVSEMQMNRARELMNAGRMSRVDFTQLESQYQSDLYNVTSAYSNYATKKLSLKQLLELGIDYDFRLKDVKFDEEQVLCAINSKTNIYNKAASWVPQLKSYNLAQQQSDYDEKIAKAGYYPKISLSGGVGTSHATGSVYGFGDQLLNGLQEQIGVTLSVPILDNKTNKVAVAKAKIDKLNAALNYQNAEKDLSQTIESIYIEAINSQAQYKSALEKVRSTQLTEELTNEQFKLGLINTLDLLSAHNNLLNARLELIQSKYMAILSIKLLEFYENKGITMQ